MRPSQRAFHTPPRLDPAGRHAWLAALRVGSQVFWTDPDDGVSSGLYEITHLDRPLHADTVISLRSAAGSEAEVFLHEIHPPADREGRTHGASAAKNPALREHGTPAPAPWLPATITALDAYYHDTLAAYAQTRALLAQVAAKHGETPALDLDVLETESAEGRGVITRLVALAREHLQRPGCAVEISPEPYLDAVTARLPRNLHALAPHERAAARQGVWARLRPSAVWQQILAEYPPERVQAEAAQRAAHALVKGLRLARQPPMREVKGKVEIVMPVYPESYCNEPRISYGCREELLTLQAALESFAHHALDDAQARAIEQARPVVQDLTRHGRVLVSRERLHLGAGIEVVTYKEQFKFYFPQDIAAALNAYVSQHAAEHLALHG